MEESVIRLIYAFSIFLSCLFSIEVSSSPPQSIADVIRDDKNISCNFSKYLSKSKYVETCETQMYPKNEIMKIQYERNIDMFLCLGIYDALYKVCFHSKQQSNLFSEKKFETDIQKLIPRKPEEQRSFCHNFNGFKPFHEEMKPMLSNFVTHLSNTSMCATACFDKNNKFNNKLCALLAWSKTLDELAAEAVAHQTESTGKPISNNSEPNSNNMQNSEHIPQPNSMTTNGNSQAVSTVDEKKTSPDKKVQSANTDANSKLSENLNQHLDQNIDNMSNGALHPKEEHILPHPSKQPSEHAGSAVNSVTDIHAKNSEEKEGHRKKEPLVDTNVPSNNEQPDHSVLADPHLTEDTKSSTLSENTQDHDNNGAQDDYPDPLGDAIEQPGEAENQEQGMLGLPEQRGVLPRYPKMRNEEDSHFFTYFTVISLICIAGYLGYHNKQKILAIMLEGRRSKNNRGRRRPSTASYRKLDCTLEEAVTSQCNANVTHVIY